MEGSSLEELSALVNNLKNDPNRKAILLDRIFSLAYTIIQKTISNNCGFIDGDRDSLNTYRLLAMFLCRDNQNYDDFDDESFNRLFLMPKASFYRLILNLNDNQNSVASIDQKNVILRN